MPRVEINTVVLSDAGGPVSGAKVQVNHRGGVATTVYADEIGTTTLANPLTTGASGQVEGWVEEGSYDLLITGPGITSYTERYEAVHADSIKGQLPGSKIADGAITNTKLADNSVTSGKIVNGAISTTHFGVGAVISDRIADLAVTTAKVSDGAVTNPKLAAGAVDSAKIVTGGVATANLADLSVTTAKVAAGAVTSAKIATGGVAEGNIAAGAVTSGKLASLSVLEGAINPAAVTETKIADGAVTTAKIGALQVTNEKVAAGVDGAKLTDGTVSNAKIAALDGAKITDGTVGAAELASSAVTPIKQSRFFRYHTNYRYEGEGEAGANTYTPLISGTITNDWSGRTVSVHAMMNFSAVDVRGGAGWGHVAYRINSGGIQYFGGTDISGGRQIGGGGYQGFGSLGAGSSLNFDIGYYVGNSPVTMRNRGILQLTIFFID